ncbi:MAG: hypothetical protein HOV94_39165 [Saccharothrix sp.]|nr:hypothetical protein [Saccharothrix sp.]
MTDLDHRTALLQWIDGLRMGRGATTTLRALALRADTDCRVDVLLADLAASCAVTVGTIRQHLRDLTERQLVIARNISTTRVKGRFLVEIRWPRSQGEIDREVEAMHRHDLVRRRLERMTAAGLDHDCEWSRRLRDQAQRRRTV